ncbi:FAD/NAD(P)-binding protein [Actinomycetospora aeridis]|uniref:FAD/NAD(P)-binding protein n=1 Tax=Actinomycetospora aeridis TaxID=3129231 RepID=A0ABU8N9J3_9PSEU
MPTFVPEPHLLDSPRGRPWPVAATGPRAHDADPPARADVVVVGAGPAGLAVVSALWHQGVRDVVVVDPGARPAERFFRRIDALGQRVLRSPYEHHPGVEGFRDCELLDFARLHWGRLTAVERREIRMAQSGHRSVVPVDVFEAYCHHLAVSHHVTGRMYRATARSVDPGPDGVVVHTDRGRVATRFAVLCPGEERRPAPTSWWGGGPPPAGVGFWDEGVVHDGGPTVVVGAGLTAAHLVTGALEAGSRVRWVLRADQQRYQCADVNATFFRPEGRARFDGGDRARRLDLLRAQRRASIMFEFRPRLEAAEADGRLTLHRGREVSSVTTGRVALADGTAVTGDRVVLALGTVFAPGAGLLPDEVVAAADGWPDLDPRTVSYARAPRVLAVGAAAGMALGPSARNIDGHRLATARVATAVAEGLRRGHPLVPADVPVAAGA